MSNGRQIRSTDSIEGLIGSSSAMQHVIMLVRRAAACRSNVLLLGESGTGKKRVAETIHNLGSDGTSRIQRINCAAADELTMEHKLFGGSDCPGLIQNPAGGTLLVGEIDALSIRLQVRILDFVEGHRDDDPSGEPRNSMRLIATSSRDLAKEVTAGRFREDLFWKLDVLPITMPPLRRRQGDVELLVLHFLESLCSVSKIVDNIHPQSLACLKSYSWPGNIRELQTYIERAFVMADSSELTPDLLPVSVMGDRHAAEEAVFRPTDEKSLVHEFIYNRLRKAPDDASDLHKQIVDPIEKELLVQILEMCKNVQKKAANRLGINRNTLYKKLKEYGLEKSNVKPAGDADEAG